MIYFFLRFNLAQVVWSRGKGNEKQDTSFGSFFLLGSVAYTNESYGKKYNRNKTLHRTKGSDQVVWGDFTRWVKSVKIDQTHQVWVTALEM